MITEILLATVGRPWIAIQRLQTIDHGGSKRSNAMIGLALGPLQFAIETIFNQNHKENTKWAPLSPEDPAPLEILAQAMTDSDSIQSITNFNWETFSLDIAVQLAFFEMGRGEFKFAYEILLRLLPRVEILYENDSLELLLVATAFIICCNATGREKEGEHRGKCIGQVGHISFESDMEATTNTAQEAHLLIAVADSLLGQSNYDEAEALLLKVLRSPLTPGSVRTRAALRLCKMSRRRQNEFSNIEDWSRLRDAIENFHEFSDSLKYECLEEVICFLSLLDPEDGPKIPQASEIARNITNYHMKTYAGSAASRQNFLDNLVALREYRNSLGLFCIRGPEWDYCRKMRDAYPKADIQFVEKVGAKNWARSQRIRDLRASAFDGDIRVDHQLSAPIISSAESVFHDSGLGSSIGSGANNEDGFVTISSAVTADDTKTVVSVSSDMSTDEDSSALPPMPHEILYEKPFRCFICDRVIYNVTRRHQWE